MTIGGGRGSLTIAGANNPSGMNYTAGTGIVIQSGAAGLAISAAGGVSASASQSWTNNSGNPFIVSSNISGSVAASTPVTLSLIDSGGGTILSGNIADGSVRAAR